jgi:hypothetical protein
MILAKLEDFAQLNSFKDGIKQACPLVAGGLCFQRDFEDFQGHKSHMNHNNRSLYRYLLSQSHNVFLIVDDCANLDHKSGYNRRISSFFRL